MTTRSTSRLRLRTPVRLPPLPPKDYRDRRENEGSHVRDVASLKAFAEAIMESSAAVALAAAAAAMTMMRMVGGG